ncbi:hypothetical protein HN587_00875 [Candidatus Woesearchaeota archaeon]|mgnify:CR=1 FL=1|jgi:hypothetical protein|nr:hypothetical protein [Candidatus Woesearchaeota archaeon]
MKKEYGLIKKKFDLPDFNVMDDYFEISKAETEPFILRNIRNKIYEYVEHSGSILDELIHPDSKFCIMIESSTFTDQERDQLMVLYKQIMFFNRWAVEISIYDSDKENAKFIKSVFDFWKPFRKDLRKQVSKLKEVWIKEDEQKEKLGYLG